MSPQPLLTHHPCTPWNQHRAGRGASKEGQSASLGLPLGKGFRVKLQLFSKRARSGSPRDAGRRSTPAFL